MDSRTPEDVAREIVKRHVVFDYDRMERLVGDIAAGIRAAMLRCADIARAEARRLKSYGDPEAHKFAITADCIATLIQAEAEGRGGGDVIVGMGEMPDED
jgi:hypothetical protein